MLILVEKPWYKVIMALTVMLTGYKCTLDTPLLDPSSHEYQIKETLFYGLTLIYISDSAINMLAYGVVSDSNTYFQRSRWNIFSFAIVGANII